MTIAITGGCGFIGSRLALALVEAGATVRVLDRVAPPHDLLGRCRYEPCDITDRAALARACGDADAIVHCAGVLRRLCDRDPADGWASNVEGTLAVTDRAIASGARVVFLSTAGIYDRPERIPIDERSPVAGGDLYSASKLAGEGVLAAAARSGAISCVVLRLFTVYGPGPASGARGHFLAHWLELARRGLPLTVHGSGDQTIDATHVDDVVRALRLAIALPLACGDVRTYNIGSGRETRVIDVAHWLREVDSSIAVSHVPRSAATPHRQLADFTRARTDLGYLPQIEPRAGIQALLRGAGIAA